MPLRINCLQVIDEWSLVSFCALDIRDEESISEVLGHIDTAIQVRTALLCLLHASY